MTTVTVICKSNTIGSYVRLMEDLSTYLLKPYTHEPTKVSIEDKPLNEVWVTLTFPEVKWYEREPRYALGDLMTAWKAALPVTVRFWTIWTPTDARFSYQMDR